MNQNQSKKQLSIYPDLVEELTIEQMLHHNAGRRGSSSKGRISKLRDHGKGSSGFFFFFYRPSHSSAHSGRTQGNSWFSSLFEIDMSGMPATFF